MMCQLRNYLPGDEEKIFAVVHLALAEYGLKTNTETTDYDIFHIQECYLDKKGIFKVLEEKGSIIGSYGLFPISETVCELRKMYLSAGHRGKRSR